MRDPYVWHSFRIVEGRGCVWVRERDHHLSISYHIISLQYLLYLQKQELVFQAIIMMWFWVRETLLRIGLKIGYDIWICDGYSLKPNHTRSHTICFKHDDHRVCHFLQSISTSILCGCDVFPYIHFTLSKPLHFMFVIEIGIDIRWIGLDMCVFLYPIHIQFTPSHTSIKYPYSISYPHILLPFLCLTYWW